MISPDEKKEVVNEQTLIPISLLVVIITGLTLGIIHVQSIASDVRSSSLATAENSADIEHLKQEDKEIKKDFNNTLTDLNSRLARMEGALEMRVRKK